MPTSVIAPAMLSLLVALHGSPSTPPESGPAVHDEAHDVPAEGAKESAVLGAILRNTSDPAEVREKRYRRQRIEFDESLLITASARSAVVTRRFHPRTGAGESLDGAKFYAYIGRDDLMSKYRARRATRIALISTGTAAALGGVGLMLGYPLAALSRRAACDPSDLACDEANSTARSRALKIGLGGGAGLLAGGTILASIGALIHPHPITSGQARTLAEDHNEALREKLDLHEREDRQLHVAPSVASGGGGVVVSGRF